MEASLKESTLGADIERVYADPSRFIMSLVRYGVANDEAEQTRVFVEGEGLAYQDVLPEGLGLLAGRLDRASNILGFPTDVLASRAFAAIRQQLGPNRERAYSNVLKVTLAILDGDRLAVQQLTAATTSPPTKVLRAIVDLMVMLQRAVADHEKCDPMAAEILLLPDEAFSG